jgi:short-subunit dehydrogenase
MELSRIIIVGASSGMGAELAVALARPGRKLALVAPRSSELEAVAVRVRKAGAEALVQAADSAQSQEVAATFDRLQQLMGGVDALVYAAGVMPDVGPDEFPTDRDRQMIEANFLGAVAWLNAGATWMQAQRRGVLCGFGSVAGDRGRRGAPVYGATKAALHTYLESLYNRLNVHGVQVVTIKPGPVRTPMTAGKKLPLLIDADVAAKRIALALERGEREVYVPGIWRWIMLAIRLTPSFVFRRLSI